MTRWKSVVWMGAGVAIMATVVGLFTERPLLAQIKAALVKDVDQPARNYISFEFYPTYAPSYTVPTGKILVIEQVSSTGISSGSLLALSFDSGDVGTASNTHRWSMYFAPPPGGFLVNQQVRIYAKGGQTINYSYGGSASQLFVQGYLLDAN